MPQDLANNNFLETQILKHGVKEGTEAHGDKRNLGFSPWNSVLSVSSVF